mmetsp:Transcript_20755/g.50643  ORF Transcript_20755/g.50643 Transcript_20755/m.50643 type:complete len:306 (+) Transcript_20755:496-1413(+)
MQIRHTLRHGAEALRHTPHPTHPRQTPQQLLEPASLSTGRQGVVVGTGVGIPAHVDVEVLDGWQMGAVAVLVLGHEPLGDAAHHLADGSVVVAGVDGELGGRGKCQQLPPRVVQGGTAVHKLDRVAFFRQIGDELAYRSVRGRRCCVRGLLAAVNDDVVMLRRPVSVIVKPVVLTWHPHDLAFGLVRPVEQVLQHEVVGAAAVGQLATEVGAGREAMVNGNGLGHVFHVFGAPVGVECRGEAAQRIVDVLNGIRFTVVVLGRDEVEAADARELGAAAQRTCECLPLVPLLDDDDIGRDGGDLRRS